MELKVWVDGIQRVVCGVTESTTCQDVVYALAHATGQIGRFTLVEKWRSSERLLAPHEQPLKVLTKWGEYANDVQFVMRRSQSDGKVQTAPNQNNQNNKRQHDFLHSFSPTPSNHGQKLPSQSKEIKKSLTFSCGHGSSGGGGSGSSENSTPVASNNSTPSKIEPPLSRNTKNRDGRSRQDLPKGVVRGIPQKSRENDSQENELPVGPRSERPKHPPPYDEAVSRSSGRFPPSHLSLSSPNPVHRQDEESPLNKHPSVAVSRSDHTTACDPETGSSDAPLNSHINTQTCEPSSYCSNHINATPFRAKSPSKSPEKSAKIQHNNSAGDSRTPQSKKNLLGQLERDSGSITPDLKHHSMSHKGDSHPEDTVCDPQYQDLMRLVTLQREKLENQQAELTQYDAEIVYWEGRLQEQEERLAVLQEEIRHLEHAQHEQESELAQIERRSLGEETELGRQEERTLRSELTLARSQLANCETELLQCRQHVRLLLEQISEERQLKALKEEQEKKEHEEQEQLIRGQTENLQLQVKEKLKEYENQKISSDKIGDELHQLEHRMAEKQKEVEKLVNEIREANLHSLAMTPAEDGKYVIEGNFHNRPGSTRKIIGSPRQLENAVPTNKNPHGVWV